jgi:hypothetical protein
VTQLWVGASGAKRLCALGAIGPFCAVWLTIESRGPMRSRARSRQPAARGSRAGVRLGQTAGKRLRRSRAYSSCGAATRGANSLVINMIDRMCHVPYRLVPRALGSCLRAQLCIEAEPRENLASEAPAAIPWDVSTPSAPQPRIRASRSCRPGCP